MKRKQRHAEPGRGEPSRVLATTGQNHACLPTITIVCLRLPNFIHSGAYDDLADSVRFALQRQGHEVRLAFGIAGIGPRTLLFGAHLLQNVANGAEAVQSDTIIFNTEHTSSDCFSEPYLSLLACHEVWDYSADNAAALAARIGHPVRHVPFGYMPELSRISPAADEDIDVLFYGSINARRRVTLDRITAAGLNVKAVFGVYGAERDALIARSKLVLNVHFYEPGHFEIVRVGYLLANRKAVVTEANPGEVVDTDLVSGLAAAPYDALTQTVLDLLGDAPRRRALGEAGFAAFAARDAGAIVGAALTASRGGEPASMSAQVATRAASATKERGSIPLQAERGPHQPPPMPRPALFPVRKLAVVATIPRRLGGTSHARIVNPLRALADEPDVSVQIVSDNIFPDIPPDTAGICILHHEPLAGEPGLDVIRQLLAKGYVIVSEFDTNPDLLPVMQGTDVFAFRGVHAVQTSTKPPADLLRLQNPEVAIFPDGMLALPAVANFSDPKRRTLFFGALNRTQDWAPLLPALNASAASVGERLHFLIVHDRTLFDALHTPHKSFVPTCDYETYLRLLGQSEIAFMPLGDTAINRLKSDFEFVEAGACRVAALASPIVYGTSIEDGNTGLLFRTPEELLYRLAWLVVNPGAAALADAARQWVAKHRLLSNQTKARIAWYHSLIARRSELTNALRKRARVDGGAAGPLLANSNAGLCERNPGERIDVDPEGKDRFARTRPARTVPAAVRRTKLAAVTMAYNEPVFLPIWRRHYGAAVGEHNLFVLDHGSDDGSTDRLGAVNHLRVPRGDFDEDQRSTFISRFHASLLCYYDVVIFSDTDEILVPDPAKFSSLADFIEQRCQSFVTAVGIEIQHLPDLEAEIDLRRPILAQRRYCRFAADCCKPLISRIPLVWDPGFHSCDHPSAIDRDLFLFHLKTMDLGMALAQLQNRRTIHWTDSAIGKSHGIQFRLDDEAFVSKMFPFSAQTVRPHLAEGFDFSFDLSRLVTGQPNVFQNFKGAVMKIPERFHHSIAGSDA